MREVLFFMSVYKGQIAFFKITSSQKFRCCLTAYIDTQLWNQT